MTAYELDPIFCRALKLLHSKSRDSAEQLRLLLEEVTKQKYGGSSRLLPAMKRMSEERYDLSKSAVSEVSVKSNTTKMGTSVPQQPHHLALPTPTTPPVLQLSKAEDVSGSCESMGGSRVIVSRHGSDGSDSDDADDLALEILEEDLMCVVCRGMDVGVRNRLVECVECHSLYHQECHRPPIQEAHASDPRRVWTCSACTKPPSHSPPAAAPKQAPPIRVGGGKPISCITSKKIEIKSQSPIGGSSMQQSPVKSGSSSSSTKTTFSSSSSKSSSSSGHSKASSSKNADLSSSSKSSALSSSSLSSSGSSSVSSSGSSGNSGNSSSKISSSKIAHADKRIQIMKKKAAKMQEKRKLSK